MSRWQEIIQDKAWVVNGLLTTLECEHLIQAAEKAGIAETHAPGDRRNRDCLRVTVKNEELARSVWERISAGAVLFKKEVWISGEESLEDGILDARDMVGRWKAYGLNTVWRLCCYPGQGHFGPHRDGDYVQDSNHRSLLTINGYLTDRPDGFGGATRFLRDDMAVTLSDKDRFAPSSDSDVLHRVEANEAGKAVVFLHGLMHDGEPLLEGSPPKWLFRTEVMFERDPETAPKLSASEQEARRLLKEAEAAETSGKIPEATKLYNKAYRLDPSLDR